MYSGNSNIRTLPVTATWSRRSLTTPTVTETRRNGNPVGERIELARYTIPVGQRVLYGPAGQRRRPSH